MHPERIVSTKLVGVMPTYDIEVDSKDHLFYGDGIATSNSHGISYSLIGYQTAFVKQHFPLHFYTAWLHYAKEKIEPQKEVKELVTDAKFMGIPVRPPKIENVRHPDFGGYHIKDETIYVGLGDVKGIGGASTQKLIDQIIEVESKLDRSVDAWSWFDFLYYIEVNKRVMQSLISIGAFACFEKSRQEMLFEYDIWRKLTKREQKLPYTNSLKLFLEQLLKSKLTDKRKRIIQAELDSLANPPHSLKDTVYNMSNWETNLIGLPLTYGRLDICPKKDEATCTCKDFLTQDIPHAILAGEVVRVKEHPIKSGKLKGQKMAFISIEDESALLESVICFPDVWKANKPYIYVGATLLVGGYRSEKKSGFIVNFVKNI